MRTYGWANCISTPPLNHYWETGSYDGWGVLFRPIPFQVCYKPQMRCFPHKFGMKTFHVHHVYKVELQDLHHRGRILQVTRQASFRGSNYVPGIHLQLPWLRLIQFLNSQKILSRL